MNYKAESHSQCSWNNINTFNINNSTLSPSTTGTFLFSPFIPVVTVCKNILASCSFGKVFVVSYLSYLMTFIFHSSGLMSLVSVPNIFGFFLNIALPTFITLTTIYLGAMGQKVFCLSFFLFFFATEGVFAAVTVFYLIQIHRILHDHYLCIAQDLLSNT